MQLVPATTYHQALVRDLARARRRVVLVSMVMGEGKLMHEVFAACEVAARRGVAVCVTSDIYTKHWLSRSKKMARWADTQASFRRLEQAGVKVTHYGHLGLNPVAGRLHVKASIIDDVVYSFGGINLSDDSFDNADYMVRTEDKVLANQLEKLAAAIPPDGSQPDRAIATHAGELLYDGGTPGVSVIYDRACELAAAARHIYYVSQYGPSGRLAGLVKAASADCYYNRVWQMPPPANTLLLRDKLAYGLRNRYTRPRFIHAKFILFELQDGTRACLSGSNNFSWDGVRYGTKELALGSTDPSLWQQLYDYLQQEIA
jgi:cardiolipin synthase A/B